MFSHYLPYISCSKVCKRILLFWINVVEQNIYYYYYYCKQSGNFKIIPRTIYFSQHKICQEVFYCFSENLQFLPHENSLKTGINVKPKVEYLLNIVHEWKLLSQDVTIFTCSPKKENKERNTVQHYLDYDILYINSEWFSMIGAFKRNNWQQNSFEAMWC